MLIDTGCSYTAEELTGFLEGQHLDLAVNTHHHEDHVGANHQLQQRFKTPIMASRESAPLIAQSPKLLPYQEVVWGHPVPTEVSVLPDKVETENHVFHVIEHTGRLPRACGLRGDDQGLVLHGRPVHFQAAQGYASGGGHLRNRPLDEEAGRSANREAHLVYRLGNTVENGGQALRIWIDYMHSLSQRARALERQGLSTSAMVNQLFGRESVLAGLTDGHISSENVVRALLRTDTRD